jgi:hypothetical protein
VGATAGGSSSSSGSSSGCGCCAQAEIVLVLETTAFEKQIFVSPSTFAL